MRARARACVSVKVQSARAFVCSFLRKEVFVCLFLKISPKFSETLNLLKMDKEDIPLFAILCGARDT